MGSNGQETLAFAGLAAFRATYYFVLGRLQVVILWICTVDCRDPNNSSSQ